MPDVKLDIIEDARHDERDGQINNIVRSCIVSGLTPGGDGGIGVIPGQSTDAVIKQALGVLGVPQPNNRHPVYTDLTCRSRQAVALAPTIVKIDCVYSFASGFRQPPEGFNAPMISGGVTYETKRTSTDANGNPIIVGFTTTEGDINVLTPQRKEVNVYRPRHWMRYENSRSTFTPWEQAERYINKVNTANPANDVGTDGKVWLCRNVSYTLENDSTTPPRFRFAYEFSLDPEGHRIDVYYTLPNGAPPENATEGNGLAKVDVYEEADFGERELFT